MYIQRQAGLFLRCLTTALVSLAYRPSKSVTNEAEVVCSEITDQLALLARSQRQITSPPVIYTIPAHTMSCLFEEHKKGCNDHSLYPPCWLTAPWGGSVRPAPSAPQNFWKDHYLWRLFFFFLLLAWYRATQPVSSSLSLWIPHHVFNKVSSVILLAGRSASRPELPNSCLRRSHQPHP